DLEINNLVDGKPIKLYYVRMHENTGSSGGFHEGMKRAYEKGYDWFWLMDDDVEPLEHALETQLKYKSVSECIHPSKVYLDGSRFAWEGRICEQTGFEVFFGDEFLNNKEWTTVNFGCFEGMLISRNIVTKISFPDKRLFTVGDDTIYGYLASKYTNNIYISLVCFVKKIDKRGKNLSRLGFFLIYRNKYVYISKRIAKSKFLWFLNFAGILIRNIIGRIIKGEPVKIIDILRGTLHGLLGIWGGEKKYLKS
ncbi:MAG: glycosyltransferase, partial [Candidatus Omnitrophica bacterium]|nr:glycosyltransferase [Candidatus Omnitrophota bacterium]